MPVLHGDDVQIGSDVVFRVEELSEFADGEAIANRHRKIRGEGSLVRIEHRSFDDFAADWIGAVQNEERNVVLGGGLHAVGHRRRVRVKPHAGILNVEDQRINADEHIVGGPPIVTVEAEHGEARGRIFGGKKLFVFAAGETVLRTEKRDELHACGVHQNVNGATSLRIEAGVIGDQANVFSTKRGELLGFENVEADLHAGCVTRVFGRLRGGGGGEQGQANYKFERRGKHRLVFGQMVPRYGNNTMIFWNAVAEAALRAQGACAMNKCGARAAVMEF